MPRSVREGGVDHMMNWLRGLIVKCEMPILQGQVVVGVQRSWIAALREDGYRLTDDSDDGVVGMKRRGREASV